jgi:3-oxoacyl-[acyl-carrier protein] reductase
MVFGCSSGFGQAIALHLLGKGYKVTGISRRRPDFADRYDSFRHFSCDVQDDDALAQMLHDFKEELKTGNAFASGLGGLVLNAGGPPTGGASELTYEAYRPAYRLVFEWKVQVVHALLPELKRCEKGRIVFVESQSLKQPIPGLVLSNSMRLAVAGFAKTLSREVADAGLTVNIVAPGSHNTPAIERIIKYKAGQQGISEAEAKRQMEEAIPVKRFGEGQELASLVGWLLSPESSFVTGQTLSHDGGNISSIFG